MIRQDHYKLVISKLFDSQNRLNFFFRLKFQQVGNGLSPTRWPDIRHIQSFQPVQAPFVGKNQQIGMSRTDK